MLMEADRRQPSPEPTEALQMARDVHDLLVNDAVMDGVDLAPDQRDWETCGPQMQCLCMGIVALVQYRLFREIGLPVATE